MSKESITMTKEIMERMLWDIWLRGINLPETNICERGVYIRFNEVDNIVRATFEENAK